MLPLQEGEAWGVKLGLPPLGLSAEMARGVGEGAGKAEVEEMEDEVMGGSGSLLLPGSWRCVWDQGQYPPRRTVTRSAPLSSLRRCPVLPVCDEGGKCPWRGRHRPLPRRWEG